MRYGRVKHVALQANTQLSLIKRQASAKVLLDAMQKGKRIINIDESTLGEMDFRRQKWRQHGLSNSVSAKDVSPRLSLILALDSLGNVYFSMTQANTDHQIFCLFLTKLVAKLKQEDSNWHQKSVLLLDNAAYHKVDGVLN